MIIILLLALVIFSSILQRKGNGLTIGGRFVAVAMILN